MKNINFQLIQTNKQTNQGGPVTSPKSPKLNTSYKDPLGIQRSTPSVGAVVSGHAKGSDKSTTYCKTKFSAMKYE